MLAVGTIRVCTDENLPEVVLGKRVDYFLRVRRLFGIEAARNFT